MKTIARVALKKIEIWIHSSYAMSKAAEIQPQAAFVAFSKSLQADWTCYKAFEICYSKYFSSQPITENKASLLCRPLNYGGIGILGPFQSAPSHFNLSKEATHKISQALIDGSNFDLPHHDFPIRAAVQKEVENEKL